MRDQVRDLLTVVDLGLLVYLLVANTALLLLVTIGGVGLVSHMRRRTFRSAGLSHRNPLTPSVSVIVAAADAPSQIVTAVQAMLGLRYPDFEVIVVVDDHVADDAFHLLQEAFDLVPAPRVVPATVPQQGQVRSVHVPRTSGRPLTVIRKVDSGRADALNAGINLARGDLIGLVGAEAVLDGDALLAVAKPFIDDPLRVVATVGMTGIANGCTIIGGRVVDVQPPRRWLPRLQVTEYLRAFLVGRTGWFRLGSPLMVSGTLRLLRHDILIDVGGLDPDAVDGEADLAIRMHRHLRQQRQNYRVVAVAEPICWTTVPSTTERLAEQRRRWYQAVAETLLRHRGMIANPRYGRIGLITLPYYIVFAAITPLVELAAVVLVPVGLLVGAVDATFLWSFLLLAYGFTTVVSVVALMWEEAAFHRHRRWRDLGVVMLAAVVENFGYRQLTALWRLQGLWTALGAPEDTTVSPSPPSVPERTHSQVP